MNHTASSRQPFNLTVQDVIRYSHVLTHQCGAERLGRIASIHEIIASDLRLWSGTAFGKLDPTAKVYDATIYHIM